MTNWILFIFSFILICFGLKKITNYISCKLNIHDYDHANAVCHPTIKYYCVTCKYCGNGTGSYQDKDFNSFSELNKIRGDI